LDGSAPLYYYRPGTGSGASSWYIHHMGGGWCISDQDCYARSKTTLGSTTAYPQTTNLDGMGTYFSSDLNVNPLMYNWNAVFMIYCDGASFSGQNYTTTIFNNTQLYYRGHLILKSIFDDLFNNRGLNQSTQVVISGCSAGGLATYLHVDWWNSRLPRTTRVVGLPDSGFFFDMNANGQHYRDQMHWVFNAQNCSGGVNGLCIFRNRNSPENCFFAEHTAPHILTPIFPFQPKYDFWQLFNVLGSTNASLVNPFGDHGVKIIRKTLLDSNPAHGIFLDSCTHHCNSCEPSWQTCPTIHINSVSQMQAFANWFQGNGKYFIFEKPYDCTQCCSWSFF